MVEFRVRGGVERAAHGGPRIHFETPEQRMIALGCPKEIADGSIFERLAAEKRSGKHVPTVVVPNVEDQRLDEYHRKRAAEIAKEL